MEAQDRACHLMARDSPSIQTRLSILKHLIPDAVLLFNYLWLTPMETIAGYL